MTWRRGTLAIAAAAALAVPGLAIAERFPSAVSAHVTDDVERIYGVVQSGDYACEKRRDVRLYGPAFTKRGLGFDRYDETKTNRFGEYEFSEGTMKRALRRGATGEFFVRAIRKDFPHDTCRRADSNPLFITFGGG